MAWQGLGPTNGFTRAAVELPHTDANCSQWETVTPGSTINAKVASSINSSDRQLEMVKTINDALNALFSSLLSQFQQQGLSSLGSPDTTGLTDISGGLGGNNLFDANGNSIAGPGGSSTGGSGRTGSFDLLTDLGNTYADAVSDGTWNAQTNSPAIYEGVGTKYHYYTVSTSGRQKSMKQMTTGIKVTKYFFDGTSWKKGVPKYIIVKNGALQDQQDYLDQTNKTLAILPQILPALGKLDECIPGPNQNWEGLANTAEQTLINKQTTDEGTNYWTGVMGNLEDEYNQKINLRYGPKSLMQTPGNSSYLAMASDGLALTKDMSTDQDTIDTNTQAYNTAIRGTTTTLPRLMQSK